MSSHSPCPFSPASGDRSSVLSPTGVFAFAGHSENRNSARASVHSDFFTLSTSPPGFSQTARAVCCPFPAHICASPLRTERYENRAAGRSTDFSHSGTALPILKLNDHCPIAFKHRPPGIKQHTPKSIHFSAYSPTILSPVGRAILYSSSLTFARFIRATVHSFPALPPSDMPPVSPKCSHTAGTPPAIYRTICPKKRSKTMTVNEVFKRFRG